jgi:hypothetical protein
VSALELCPPKRILVVVNGSIGSDLLRDAIRAEANGSHARQVLLIAPALNSRIRHWLSDEDRARWDAGQRLCDVLDELRDERTAVEGVVGDADPVQAVEDALAVFPADSVVLVSSTASGARRLDRDLVWRVRELTSRPVTQIILGDTAAEALADRQPRVVGRAVGAAAA